MSQPTPEKEPQNPLKDLLGKSWNLELIISGAAIVLTTYLPDLVDSGLYFQLQFIDLQPKKSLTILPVLAFGFFKVIAWVLTAVFLIHLVLRAYWVGLVGLLAAFPEGIRYDKLPTVSENLRRLQQEKLGGIEGNIARVDKMCNQIFALGFLIAMTGGAIGILYHIVFWTANTFVGIMPDWASQLFSLLFAGGLMSLAILMLYLNDKVKKDPVFAEKYGDTVANAQWKFGHFIPFLSRQIAFIQLTFMSNIKPRRFYTVMALTGILVISGAFVVFIEKLNSFYGRNLFGIRDYYAEGDWRYQLKAQHYDNLRNKPDQIPAVSIASDIVEEPFLRVYVVYPKHLDANIKKLYPPVETPDSLKGLARVRLRDSLNLAILNRYFQLSVNDSAYNNPGWVYHDSPVAPVKGLTAYIPTDKFKTGKNLLTVKIPSADKPDSLRILDIVPFWYSAK